jgi:hypothetical protein
MQEDTGFLNDIRRDEFVAFLRLVDTLLEFAHCFRMPAHATVRLGQCHQRLSLYYRRPSLYYRRSEEHSGLTRMLQDGSCVSNTLATHQQHISNTLATH